MPYLEYLFCERCGKHAQLELDPGATISAYRKEGRASTSLLQQTMIWDYMIYTCGICHSEFCYTYRDVERHVREYFSSLSLEFKEYFDKVIEDSEKREQVGGIPSSVVSLKRKASTAQDRVRDVYTAKK